MNQINIEHTPPSAAEYLALRKSAGLSAMSKEERRLGCRIACLPYVCVQKMKS